MTLQKNSYTSCCMLALCMLVPANLTATTAQKIQHLSEETVRVERAVQLTHEAWVEEKTHCLMKLPG